MVRHFDDELPRPCAQRELSETVLFQSNQAAEQCSAVIEGTDRRYLNITLIVCLGSATYIVWLGSGPGRTAQSEQPLHNAAARVVPSDVNERVFV